MRALPMLILSTSAGWEIPRDERGLLGLPVYKRAEQ